MNSTRQPLPAMAPNAADPPPPSQSSGSDLTVGSLPVAVRGPPLSTETGPASVEGVIELDTLLGGWERVTAGYLVEGDAPVLVETGSQSSVPALLAHLGRLGIGG